MSIPEINSLTQFKKNVNVLLLGPYGECENELNSIKNYLASVGYKNTKTVLELPEFNDIPIIPEDAYFLEKSRRYIKNWSSINLFHFTSKCNCNSVIVELSYLCTNVVGKCRYATIISESGYHLGTLVLGNAQSRRIPIYEYDTPEDLLEIAFAAVYNASDVLYHI